MGKSVVCALVLISVLLLAGCTVNAPSPCSKDSDCAYYQCDKPNTPYAVCLGGGVNKTGICACSSQPSGENTTNTFFPSPTPSPTPTVEYVAPSGNTSVELNEQSLASFTLFSNSGGPDFKIVVGDSAPAKDMETAGRIAAAAHSNSSIIVLASNANRADNLILVGSPSANPLTREALSMTNVGDLARGQAVVMGLGVNRIIIAGGTSDDTAAAATEFITWMQRQ